MPELMDKLVVGAKRYKNLVLFSGDVGEFGLENFGVYFGERFNQFGLGSSAMLGAACGFALRGKIPVVVMHAKDVDTRIVSDLIVASGLNVKLVVVGELADCGLSRFEFADFEEALEMHGGCVVEYSDVS